MNGWANIWCGVDLIDLLWKSPRGVWVAGFQKLLTLREQISKYMPMEFSKTIFHKNSPNANAKLRDQVDAVDPVIQRHGKVSWLQRGCQMPSRGTAQWVAQYIYVVHPPLWQLGSYGRLVEVGRALSNFPVCIHFHDNFFSLWCSFLFCDFAIVICSDPPESHPGPLFLFSDLLLPAVCQSLNCCLLLLKCGSLCCSNVGLSTSTVGLPSSTPPWVPRVLCTASLPTLCTVGKINSGLVLTEMQLRRHTNLVCK